VPSVELFRRRAEAARPDFALTPAALPAVAAICRRLDGLPLAIELAAARIRMLTPVQLQQRLDRPLDALSSTDWDVPDRHRTLRATMAWSYGLLGPQEQDLFRQLSTFRGSWSLASFASVVGTPPEHLASLVDHSLVFTQHGHDADEPRFAMLQTIRDYAEECLIATGEQDAALRRHAEVFLALAEEAAPHLEGAAQAAWLQRLEQDHPNLTAALHWLRIHEPALALRLGGALWRFWWLLGLLTEGAQELGQLQQLSVPDAPGSMARVHDGAGVLAESRSEYKRAAQCYEAAVASWREAADERGLARALLRLGTATAFQGERDLAATYHREGLQRLRALGDQRGVAVALTNLGLGNFLAGECEAAVRYDQEGLLIWRELGDPQGLALALDNLGEAELCNGDPVAAWACHDEALRIQLGIDAKRGIASALINLGITARVRRDLALAEAQLTEGLRLAQTVGDIDAVSRALDALAGVAGDQGRFPYAAQLHGAAASLRKTHGIELPPVYRPGYERDLAAAQSHLGEEFAPAWEAGASLGITALEAMPES
jgi:tetratricopeptide (TPR) repeat protein